MKKKIIILGSTGSIGNTTLDIINGNRKNYKLILISTNKNYKRLFFQAKKFDIKNVIIHDKKTFISKKKFFKSKKINIFNNVKDFKKKNSIKVNYVMSAITGIGGLEPTIDIISITDEIAIANKESIICGWNLISKSLKKNKTKFIPIDSEHFSIAKLIENEKIENIKKIYITASGGPFLNKKINYNEKVNKVIDHPTWKMGKKISVDSSTFANKVLEDAKVAITPGLDFDPKNGHSTIRFSYARSTNDIINGLEKLNTFMKNSKYI